MHYVNYYHDLCQDLNLQYEEKRYHISHHTLCSEKPFGLFEWWRLHVLGDTSHYKIFVDAPSAFYIHQHKNY